jgi:hypothetical protein
VKLTPKTLRCGERADVSDEYGELRYRVHVLRVMRGKVVLGFEEPAGKVKVKAFEVAIEAIGETA